MIHINTCPICNNTDFNTFLELKDYFLSQEDFKIDCCKQCGFKFTNPIPEEADLGAYYKSTDYVSHSDTKKGLFFKLYHYIKKRALKSKYNIISSYFKTGRILDYGCGTGDVLKTFKDNNWEVMGIEPDEDTRKYAISKNSLTVLDVNEFKNINKNSFDVVSLWHVLEHIPDLNEKIFTFKSLIKDNGILLIAVPNCNSYDARYYKKYWAAFDVPRHLYHFNHKSIKELFEKHDLKIIKQLPMIFDSFYVSMLSEKYKKNPLSFLKGMIIGFISNLSAHFSKNKNFSSTIYILQKNMPKIDSI